MRNTIYEIISQIKPHDDLEKAHINETISWIKNAQQIFRVQKPDVPNKHLVSYFVLFDKITKKILLGDHSKSGLWLPSGGHVEVDEHSKETVRRECLEELGVRASFYLDHPIFLTSTVTVGHTDVSLWYVLNGDSNCTYEFDRAEFKHIEWFSFDEIPYEKSDIHMSRFVDKFKSYIQLL